MGIDQPTPQAPLDVAGLIRGEGGALILPLPTPTITAVTPIPSGGSTTWGYRVTAVGPVGIETVGSNEVLTITGPASLDSSDYNTVTWGAVTGAVAYNVYRTTAGGTPTSTGYLGQVTSTSYQVTGAAAQAGDVPPTFDLSGWVGVGTAAPGGRLDLAGGGYLAIDNGDYGAWRGLRFRNTTDGTTPSGGGLYQANNDVVYLQAGQANAITLRDGGGNDLARFTNVTGGTFALPTGGRIQPFGADAADALALATAEGTPVLAVDTLNQRVGIGLTAPLATLDVNGYLHVAGSTSPAVAGQGGYLNWNALNGGGTGETDFINNQGGGPGGFAFCNTTGSGLGAPLVFIAGSGEVGIGTASPQVGLHIEGAYASLRVGSTAQAGLDYAAGSGDLYLGGDNAQSGDFYVKDLNGNTQVALRSDGGSYLTAGALGIGTSSPGHLLDVLGDVGSATAYYAGSRKVADTTGCYYA